MARPLPLVYSVQTRSLTPDGTMGFAFHTPYATLTPLLGPGVACGSLNAYEGPLQYQHALVSQVQLGQVAGTLALQPLQASDYVRSNLLPPGAAL